MLGLVIIIIAILSLIISIALGIFFKQSLSSLKSKMTILESQQQVSELLIDEMKLTIKSHNEIITNNAQNTENEQVINQLEYRIKSLQNDFIDLSQQVKQFLDHQPEDKLYTRAFKLAAKGADVEEIITECELPRAEAEMLLSVYKTNQSNF
ncbi:MAG: DUF2802 domain-containing protein [Colwellia sp.]|nr:DUF2802 domain-containing protein [Colwellia sp.]